MKMFKKIYTFVLAYVCVSVCDVSISEACHFVPGLEVNLQPRQIFM